MYREVLAQRLKKAREMNGMTQQEVAKNTKIPIGSLSKYEVNLSEPPVERIGTLADFYGVSVDWLFGLGMQGRNPNYYEDMKIQA